MEKLGVGDERESGSVLTKDPRTAVSNPFPECEMDALLLGRIGSTHAQGGAKLKSDNAMEELVSITPNERNWRGICIALLVIVAVLALILFFIVLLSPPYEGPFNPGIKFSIDHVISGEFESVPFNGSWISDNEFVFRDAAGGVSIFNTRNNSARILINNSTFRMSNGVDYSVSADLKYVLITKDIKKIHTNTKKAKYRIQEVASQNHVPLSPYLINNPQNSDALYIQEVLWSPRGHAIVFVYMNNIFYKPEVLSTSEVYQITYSGSQYVHNGVADWLYQEKITKTRKCMWISPDGRYLAFASFNDTSVGELKYPMFKTNNQYPEIHALSYPKVGTANPEAIISVTSLYEPRNGTFVNIKQPKSLYKNETYFINLIWGKNHQFAVIWINREQTMQVISVCSKPLWHCDDVHEEKVSEIGGWVEPNPDLIFSHSGKGFITILPTLDGDERYPQINYVDVSSKVATPITLGQIVVTSIRAWDQISKMIFFEAAPKDKPTQRHVYNVTDSLTQSNAWHCLTCPVIEDVNNRTNITFSESSTSAVNISVLPKLQNITKNNRSEDWPLWTDACRFVRSYFPQLYEPIRFYVLECLGPEVPKVLLMNIFSNKLSYLLNNQTELAAKYAQMAKPQIKLLQVELDSGYKAQVKVLIPPVYRERLEMEFPFVLYVDNVPGSQSVTDEWKVDWNTYFVSNMNIVIGVVDGRGSSGQSEEMKYEIQKKIGIYDVEDQVSALFHIRDEFTFIDRTRTGVWGKAYGGYVTARILEQDNGTFQCGIAIAPITSWSHYVSYSAERVLGTANVTDNYRGYEEADLTKRVAHLKDKKLLLIHGTADKLVHYQHTMLLVHSFTKFDVLFHHLTYPDEDHEFITSSHHVIHAMENFWNSCFGPVVYEDFDEGLSFLAFAR